jgi:septum formation protein
MTPELILASGSRYRADLLRRFGIPFRSIAPDVDESQHPGEPPRALAVRLAAAKAAAVASRFPRALVIGADQTADLGGRALGKPGNPERAREQLLLSSGHQVAFHTAVCVLRLDPSFEASHCDSTLARLRTLEAAEVTRYIDREPALDCAGSFKVEGLGITLFDAVESHDPTALVGLPLIGLARLLRQAGLQLP